MTKTVFQRHSSSQTTEGATEVPGSDLSGPAATRGEGPVLGVSRLPPHATSGPQAPDLRPLTCIPWGQGPCLWPLVQGEEQGGRGLAVSEGGKNVRARPLGTTSSCPITQLLPHMRVTHANPMLFPLQRAIQAGLAEENVLSLPAPPSADDL